MATTSSLFMINLHGLRDVYDYKLSGWPEFSRGKHVHLEPIPK